MRSRVTVVGARGFVGSAVVRKALALGLDVLQCRHDDVPSVGGLGTVMYCSGLAWDAEKRAAEAYELHVTAVARIVESKRADRIVYVSSTRAYDRASGTSEDDVTGVLSAIPADTYALSKLAGEGLTLSASSENRVLRCSNVYGESFRSGLFLSDVLRQAVQTGRVELRSSLDSSKDYVAVEDVAEIALRMRDETRHRVYNVAAGSNTTHRALLEVMQRTQPFELRVAPDAPTVTVPEIDAERVRAEFAFRARDVLDDLPELLRSFRSASCG